MMFFQCVLPELDNLLSKKVRGVVGDLLEKRPNSMKVSSRSQNKSMNGCAAFSDLCLPLVA